MRSPRNQTKSDASLEGALPAVVAALATEPLRVLQNLINESHRTPSRATRPSHISGQNDEALTLNGNLHLNLSGLEHLSQEPISQTVVNDPYLLKYPSPESLIQDMPIRSQGPIPVPMAAPMVPPPNYMMIPPPPKWQSGYPESQNPYLMLKSTPIPVSSKDPTDYFGIAALEFNHPYVQNQFSVATQASLFKPLMAAVSVIRRTYQASLGRSMPDDQWLAIFTDCGSRITSRALKIVSRLYAAAAKGDPERCHDLILMLAQDGLVKGSESRIARPVTVETADGQRITWGQLVGHMCLSINRLLTETEPPAAPLVGINGTLPLDFS